MRSNWIEKLSKHKFNFITLGFIFAVIVLFLWTSESTQSEESSAAVADDETSDAVDYEALIAGTRTEVTCDDAGCHEGIETISPKMDFACTSCHKGLGSEPTKEEAHKGMYPNPGDMSVVDETCGPCHSEWVEKIKKSFHATSAGVISGARYTWGAQERDSKYSNYAVTDDDGDVPTEMGALPSLDQIPTFDESDNPVDDYLRNQCLRCHIYTEGAKRTADYRSSGCSACHVLYSDEGGYEGSDPTVNLSDPDNPIKHEMTKKIPAEQCVHCHNRGGRTGVSFIGTMESDGYGTPFNADGSKQGKLHGKYYNHLSPDVHYERGMQCIDCHTASDIMGDGNIYSKKEEAVEIECQDCHGTPTEYPWDESDRITTSGGEKSDGTKYGTVGGNDFINVKKEGDKVILTSKYDGKTHEVPILKQIADSNTWNDKSGKIAMSSVPHLNALECYACHAAWAPQCYGCHAKMDERGTGKDWVSGGDSDANSWSESRSYLRWETPVLGINAEGLVSPYVPGCQVIFTHIDENGNSVSSNKIFTTVDGTSGIAQNPIQPHTISAKPRTCEDCHTNPKTLGLGTGTYDSSANGLSINFELERIVDEEGNQIQATSHNGARPFNKAEQEKISRVGVCIGCHDTYSDPIWDDITDITGFATTTASHESVMGMVMNSLTEAEQLTVFWATSGTDGKIFLQWEYAGTKDVDFYEVYWSESPITDVSTLTPNAEPAGPAYTVSGLEEDTDYYFAIVAVDTAGNRTGIAFTNAIPTLPGEVSDGEAEDEFNAALLGVGIFIIIVFLVFIFILFRAKKKPVEEPKEEEEEKVGRRPGRPGGRSPGRAGGPPSRPGGPPIRSGRPGGRMPPPRGPQRGPPPGSRRR